MIGLKDKSILSLEATGFARKFPNIPVVGLFCQFIVIFIYFCYFRTSLSRYWQWETISGETRRKIWLRRWGFQKWTPVRSTHTHLSNLPIFFCPTLYSILLKKWVVQISECDGLGSRRKRLSKIFILQRFDFSKNYVSDHSTREIPPKRPCQDVRALVWEARKVGVHFVKLKSGHFSSFFFWKGGVFEILERKRLAIGCPTWNRPPTLWPTWSEGAMDRDRAIWWNMEFYANFSFINLWSIYLTFSYFYLFI